MGARAAQIEIANRRPVLGAFGNGPHEEELVERHLELFQHEVVPLLEGLEHGVIHNDANDYNLLVRNGDDDEAVLAGLIDFGDSLHTITIAELAIAATYLMLDREYPLTTAALITTGYNSVRPLTTGELGVLFDLIKARLCASVLMSARGLHFEPENEYLQISVQPVWRLLERMSMVNSDEARRTFEDACATFSPPIRSADEIVNVRRRHFGFNLSVSYSEPLKIIRGDGQYLYDDSGNRYLDLVNNVCHVGHCHPHVVSAAQQQLPQSRDALDGGRADRVGKGIFLTSEEFLRVGRIRVQNQIQPALSNDCLFGPKGLFKTHRAILPTSASATLRVLSGWIYRQTLRFCQI